MTENEWAKLTAAVDDCFLGKPERLIQMVKDYELQKVFDLVASLREELHEAKEEVGRLEEEVDELRSEVDDHYVHENYVCDLEKQIEEYQRDNGRLEDKVSELESQISDMNERGYERDEA